MALPYKAIGTLAGAFVQDPLDHPLASVAGGAIGYYAAANLSVHNIVKPYSKAVRDIKIMGSQVNLSDVLTRNINTSLARNDIAIRNIADLEKEFADGKIEKSQLKKAQRIYNKFVKSQNVRLSNLDLMHQTLTGNGFLDPNGSLVDNLTTAKNIMGGVKNSSHQHSLLTAFSTRTQLVSAEIAKKEFVGVGNKAVKHSVAAAVSLADKQSIITKHLISSSGHALPQAEAERIAKSIAPALDGHGFTLSNNLTLHTGRGDISFPLQYNASNGTRYTQRGNLKYPAKGWNPFALAYINKNNVPDNLSHLVASGQKTPLASDVLTRLQPIERLAMLDKTQDIYPQLRKMSNDSWRLSDFASNYMADPNDPLARNITDRVHFTQVLDKEGQLIPLSTVSVGSNASDYDSVIRRLTEDAGNIKSIIPLNDKNSISAVQSVDAAAFTSMERGGNTVTMRDLIQTQAHRDAIKRMTGLDYVGNEQKLAGLGNAEIKSSLMVDDGLADLVPHMFGDKYTLADGSGLFSKAEDFKFERMNELVFHNTGTEAKPSFVLSAEFQKGILDPNYVLKPGELLGIDGLGSPIHLGKEYSGAQVVGYHNDGKQLRIQTRAYYTPDDWVKIFSSNAKAGLTNFGEENARMLTAMQEMVNKGLLKFDTKNATNAQIRAMAKDAMQKATAYMAKSKKPIEVPQIMLRRGEAGFKIVGAALDKAANVHPQKRMASLRKAMYEQIITDGKANQSANVTLLETLHKKGLQSELDQMHHYIQNGGYAGALERGEGKAYLSHIKKSVNKAFTKIDDFTFSSSLISGDLGPAIRGAGNEGSVSWLEKMNLLYSGWTTDDFDKVATWDRGALTELQMAASQAEYGKSNFSAIKLDKYKAHKLATIFAERAENRGAALKELGIKIADDAAYVSYELTHKNYLKYNSIPIPLVETNVSRTLDFEGREILSTIEKRRAEVIKADLDLALYDSQRGSKEHGVALKRFTTAIDDLHQATKSMMSGDNNMVKAGLRMRAPGSEIQIARSLGGEFGMFAAQQQRAAEGAFETIAGFNRESIVKLANAQGIKYDKLEFQGVGEEFAKVMYRDKNNELKQLRFWSTREPAQGPGSTLAVDVYYHRGLKEGTAWMGLPQMPANAQVNKNAQELFAFADYDSDTFKTASFGNMSAERIEELVKKQRLALKDGNLMAELANRMAIKGSNTASVKLEDFKKAGEFNKYLGTSALKGVQRKNQAAAATDIATRMAETLNLHLESLQGSLTPEEFAKRQFASRLTIHNLIENLLKTQHIANSKIGDSAMPIQRMAQLFESLDNETAFRHAAGKIMDETVGHNMGSGSGASKEAIAAYNTGKNDVIDSVVKYHKVVKNRLGSLEANRSSLVSGIESFAQSLHGLAENKMLPGLIDRGATATPKNAMRALKTYAQYGSDLVRNNKKVLGVTAVASAAAATVLGSDSMELSKDSLPLQTSDAILPPIPDQKGYATKGRDYRGSSHSVKGSTSRSDHKQMANKALFNNSPTANIRVQDKREGKDIRELRF